MKTNTYYRVRPESDSFSHEDFETLEEAIKRASDRNRIKPVDYDANKVYKGDNCRIQKVTVTVEEISL